MPRFPLYALRSKRVAVVVLVAGFALLLGTPASAHSVLLSSTPAANAAIAAAPAQAVLQFNEPLEPGFTELVVLGPDGGSHWEGGPPSIVDGKVSAPLRTLGPAGGYTIRYRVISADGHPVSGTVLFTLTVAGAGTAAPAPAAAAQAAMVAPDSSMPLWPWIIGAAILFGTGFAVARRVARAG
jgi:methionine-rich copper-binding protein CopC